MTAESSVNDTAKLPCKSDHRVDVLGNLKSRKDLNQTVNGSVLLETFNYDALNRLINSTVTGQTQKNYEYDILGNLTKKDGVGDYAYDPVHKHAVRSINGGPAATYDANGNMLSGFNRTIDWTWFNQPQLITGYSSSAWFEYDDSHLSLIAGTDVSGQQSRYEMYYDALGRRCVTILNGSTTYYIYDGEKAILEYRGWSAPSAVNVYGKGIDEILKRTETGVNNGQPFYYQQDHEGSITHLTNATGNIIEYYRYDAFGNPTIYDAGGHQIAASALRNRVMFTGREYVANFGVYEYRNRAYHPGLGRFMSEDPKLFDAKDANLFRYCGNDPLDHTDPMGEYFGWDDAAFAAGGAVVGLGSQLVQDAVSGHFSDPQTYAAAAVGGALGGWLLEYTGPVVASTASAAATDALKQGLEIASGKQEHFSGKQLLGATAIGAVTGRISTPPIRGLNAGRNSYNAISKGMITKLRNGTVSRGTPVTAVKMAAGAVGNQATGNLVQGAVNGAMAAGQGASAGNQPEKMMTMPVTVTSTPDLREIHVQLTNPNDPRVVEHPDYQPR